MTGQEKRAARSVALAALLVGLGACQGQSVRLQDAERVPRFSIVFVIHGDGSYLYHDADGQSLYADQEAMRQAVLVSRNNPEAEVFLFHQRLARNRRADSRFLLYRFGRLTLSQSYQSDRKSIDVEAALFQAHTAAGPSTVTLFLYFGHQLSESSTTGYHASRPDASWGVPDLAAGLAGFQFAGNPLDLLVLSTCNNGTPTAVRWFAEQARYLVASPADLHLSHMSMETLHHLGIDFPGEIDPYRLATDLAQRSFDSLTARVSTVVTIAVFDLQKVKDQLAPAVGVLRDRLTRSGGRVPVFYDCGEDPELNWVDGIEGVEVFYNPPRFGRDRLKTRHSGLQCFRFGAAG